MPTAILHLGRYGMLTDRYPSARGIQKTDRLVRQLPVGDVTFGEPNCRSEGLIQELNPMVLLKHRSDPTHHEDCLGLVRLPYLDRLKAPSKRRVIFDVLLVLGPGCRGNGAQGAARQSRLEQVGRIARSLRAPRPDQRMRFINEEDDRFGGGVNLVDHLSQALLEFSLHASAGLQKSQVEGTETNILQRGGDIALGDPLCEALNHCRLTHSGFSRENRVVLPPSKQDLNNFSNLFVAPNDRINLALARALGQIDRVLGEGLLSSQSRSAKRTGLTSALIYSRCAS